MRKCIHMLVLLGLFLGLHEGYLALKEGEAVKHIFPYRMELYTNEDAYLLRNGIPLPSPAELAAALEDYFS